MASLKDWDIIKLSTLITNVDAKLSASTRTDRGYQILCLVRRNDQILFRYIDEKGEVHLMLLCWFAENQKCIQDVCFDNSESWLLVFCYDNTLHIVPALSICDKSATVEPTFTRDEITSFIVPFIGPHECPNPQTCPNNSHNVSSAAQSHRSSIASETSVRSSLSGSELGAASGLKRSESMHTTHKIDEIFSLNSIYNQLHGTEGQQSTAQDPITPIAMKTIENFFAEGKDDRMGASGMDTKASTPQECFSHTISSSIESTVSVSCPYPTCCSWWETLTNEPRAILGYSDGSICVVALTPNCPFLGNTNCERGSIEKLIICQDNSMETISLMINTSTKEQWKLLLEQKSIKYTFPGDISPSSSQELKEEMLKSLGDGEKPNSGLMDDWQIVLSLPKEGSGSGGDQGTNSGGEKGSSPSGSEPQSSDDFEKVEGECSTEDGKTDARDQQGALPKLFPAARARLMSLRDLGAKKIGTLKLKLSESRIKAKEKERIKEQAANLAVMELPGMYPEILTTPAGPYFVVQYLNGKYLLSALHSYSDTLSVHSMDISLIPLHIYKVPKQCKSTVLTRNVIYVTHHLSLGSERTTESTNSSPDANPETVGDLSEQPRRNTDSSIENLGSSQSQTQDEDASTETTNSGTVNAVSVVSCQLAAVKMGDDCDFNEHAMLALFQFPDEKILEIHRISPLGDGSEAKDPDDTRFNAPDESGDVRSVFQKSSVSNYLKMQRILRMDKKLETHESQVMVGEFPKVEFDRAAIVTDKNLYSLELNDTARNLFLKLAHKSLWAACEDFCLTFGLPLATCVEYAGDVLLKRKKITEALMTYNVARLSPMKTALKLASVNENGALMKLCSMALRNSHIINSQFVMHDVMRILVDEAHLGNVVYDSLMNLNAKVSLKPINAGAQCSDFSYENDDVSWDVQISTTAQFHLSNLMLLTLCERCVQDKNYIPLWNFIVTNSKYHTSLACIVLAHGKLYSSVILLAMVRGTCLDVFSWLIGIWEQLVDHPAEMNAYVYNLSNELFMESLIYLQEYTIQYFEMIRKCLEKFDINVLERLIRQLNPFHPIYRPLMHKLSNHDSSSGRELDNGLLLFCKCLIETFLAVSIRLQMLKMHNGSFLNALKHVRVFYDEKPVEMRLKQCSPLSAGFSHAGCVMNRVAYLWGSNGVNCALSRTSLQGDPLTPNGSPPTAFFLKQLDLEVLAVQCGRLHTLLLTNNGVYSMGANNLGQLGIGNHVLNALQPMYVQSLDGMNITHICAGQYHNAVVANGLLYTWGWGIFGQLGHGSIADCSKPTIVEFFRKKNIQQIALGHAHTLVLCRQECNTKNVLYVFGSNHYGQLGLGQEDRFNFTVDTRNGKSFVLSLIPRRVDFDEEILLINTKLFVNLVLTKSNKLYTWGASPQALRLANQARKRARSSHKCRPNVMTPAATAGPSTSPPSAEPEAKTDGPEPESKSLTVSNVPEESNEEQQPKIEPEVEQQPAEGVDETPKTPNGGPVPDIKIEDTSAGEESKTPDVDEKAATPGEEFAEHLFPSLVDTTLVQDDIVRISSGLYHFALVTSRSQIYTWGKNIERQLGREGGRNEVLIPTKLDAVTGVEYVECGADFTLIMTEDGVVKSWGNNNMGQCAKEINQERSGVPGKLVRLPISNRLVRIPDSSQFIELPHEIKLPPSDGSHEPSNQTLRLIKSMPKFRRNFVVKSTLEKVISNNISTISSSLNDVSNTTEMEDFVGELRTAFDCRIQNQNASTMSSLQSVSYATSPTSMAVDDDEDDEGLEDMDQDDRSSESSRLCNERHLLSNDFIHYCLYIFHGLYSQDNILELTKRCNEYHIRMMILNYDYVEAFHLILELLSGSLSSSASPVTVAKTTMNLVKIFEYFTKDSNIIPMDTSNFKYFIYELFMFFIKHNINLDVLEEYFLRNLEYYLVQLAFVLYFSNTNNISAGLRGNVDSETLEMERRLLDKFNNNGNNLLAAEAFGPSSPQSTGKVVRKLENTETISKALSTKFSVMLCQKLMEYFERFK
uniref:Putative e3 ubiquitin-protein ligase herc2 n=1 Tax=Aedes aegypti TaxID=7159 RepID=A0A0P6J635_AEDAE